MLNKEGMMFDSSLTTYAVSLHFSENQKPGFVHFTGIGNFKEKVLFLKPEKDGFLTEINSKLHELILPEFEKGDNGYYLPEVWFPHTTLATRN